MPMPHSQYYIGTVAERTGASRKAIRLYEERGLIPKPMRVQSYRVYTDNHIELIQIIKQAQALGFRLAEIQAALANSENCDAFPYEEAIELVRSKIEANLHAVAELKQQNTELKSYIKILEKKCES